MNKKEALRILDALASGCSPFTGELLENHEVLDDRNVIRALQIAIDALLLRPFPQQKEEAGETEIKAADIISILELMQAEDVHLSSSTVTKFLLGSKKFKAEALLKHRLFGSQNQSHTYATLKPFVVQFFADHPAILKKYLPLKEVKPWAGVDYFEQPLFCKLSAKAQEQLKEKINTLGIVKETSTQPEYIIKTRETFARAYEPWSDTELDYLAKALLYTNDLQVLTACFQRGEGSIISVGKKLIFEGKAKASNDES